MSNTYSLSQRWSPATSLDEENRLCRPHFQVIMNETSGDLVAVNVSLHRLSPSRLADWATDAGVSRRNLLGCEDDSLSKRMHDP